MANQILAGAVINAGMVIAGVDADNPPVTGSTPAPTDSWIVVGATYSSDNGANSGAAYVYDANDLSATPTKLTAFDGGASDNLGSEVSATADKIIVSARNDDDRATNAGAVYVWDANDLSATPTKLTAFDGGTNDVFGMSAFATDDKIVISATGAGAGAVYVYDANDLSATPTKLTETNGASDLFGYQVAANSDQIIVGAPLDDDDGTSSGSLYVYDANNLSAQPIKLTAFDGGANDQFGQFIAASSDKIVVGAFGDDDNGSNSGAVYVYDANNLTAQPTKLTAFDGVENDRFGAAVAVTADKILVGSYANNSNVGAVYVYDANDLSATPTKLTAFDGAVNDYFGYSIAATADTIAVVAFADDDNNQSDSGSVYVYDANDLNATPTKLTAYDAAANYYFGMGHKGIAIG